MALFHNNDFMIPTYPNHNLRLYTTSNQLWKPFRIMMCFLRTCQIAMALTYETPICDLLIQEFWRNAHVRVNLTSDRFEKFIRTTIGGRTVDITEDLIRTLFHLGPNRDVREFKESDVQQTMRDMGYKHRFYPNNMLRSKHNHIWQYFISQIQICFSNNVTNIDYVCQRTQEVIHALVRGIPFNYASYIMRNMVENASENVPFRIILYPRFVMKIITHFTGFAGLQLGIPTRTLKTQDDLALSGLRYPTPEEKKRESHTSLQYRVMHQLTAFPIVPKPTRGECICIDALHCPHLRLVYRT